MPRHILFVVLPGRTLYGVLSLVLAAGAALLGPGVQQAVPVAVNVSEIVSGKLVVIDPGHGGRDPGAQGPGETLEKDVVLAVALELQPLLHRAGIFTILTRTDDSDLAGEAAPGSRKRQDLARRVEIANSSGADLFVSLHANSYPSAVLSGAQTFYFSDKEADQALAAAIQRELVTRLPPNHRQARPAEYRVLRDTEMPAVVVELGFLSNPREEELLRDPAHQRRLAEAVYHGIIRFLVQSRPEKGAQRGGSGAPGAAPQGRRLPLPAAGPSADPADAREADIALYFYGAGNIQDGLAGEVRRVGLPAGGDRALAKAQAALAELIRGPAAGSALLPTVPADVRVLSLRLEGDTLFVDFSRELSTRFWGGGRSELLTVYSIVNTLTQFPEIRWVKLSIEGDANASIGGHVDLGRPFAYNAEVLRPGGTPLHPPK